MHIRISKGQAVANRVKKKNILMDLLPVLKSPTFKVTHASL